MKLLLTIKPEYVSVVDIEKRILVAIVEKRLHLGICITQRDLSAHMLKEPV
jgi:hypothetical protein